MRSSPCHVYAASEKNAEAYVIGSPPENLLPANLSNLSGGWIPLKLRHHKQQEMVERVKHQVAHKRPAIRKDFATRGQGGS